NKAMSIFNNAQARQMIPDPNLRAAFAAIGITSFTPVQQYFLNNANYFTGGIQFGQPGVIQSISETDPNVANDTATILVNNIYQNEPFYNFITPIIEELLHAQGNAGTPNDEGITNFLGGISQAEILAQHPKLAYLNTELTRRLNGFVQMML